MLYFLIPKKTDFNFRKIITCSLYADIDVPKKSENEKLGEHSQAVVEVVEDIEEQSTALHADINVLNQSENEKLEEHSLALVEVVEDVEEQSTTQPTTQVTTLNLESTAFYCENLVCEYITPFMIFYCLRFRTIDIFAIHTQ